MSKTVLVTGGAKRLGAAIARRLAADGWRVAIHYHRSVDAAQALADEIEGAVVQGDLADPTIGAWLLADAEAALGKPLTALVNSASVFAFDRPEAFDRDLLGRLMQVNVAAPAALARDLMARAPGDAAVVNLLDQKLANPNPDFFSYTLSKAALAEATVLMAQAFAPRVRVNAVAPGLTLPSGDQSAAAFDRVSRANLLERPVGAAAVAAGVAYLLGAESVTGQTLYVDCGQRFVKRDGDVMFEGAAAWLEFTTILDNLDIEMRLGIHPHEAVPQRVRLSVWMTVDYAEAPSADRIDEVLDYDFVRDGIRRLAAGPGFALQETLVEAVAAVCLADRRVRQVRVRSMKPDVYPDAAVGCEIVRARA